MNDEEGDQSADGRPVHLLVYQNRVCAINKGQFLESDLVRQGR